MGGRGEYPKNLTVVDKKNIYTYTMKKHQKVNRYYSKLRGAIQTDNEEFNSNLRRQFLKGNITKEEFDSRFRHSKMMTNYFLRKTNK